MKFENIRNLREDNDKTQKEVAAYLNIKQTTYSKYELGKINVPIDVFIKLADYYTVSIDYLVGRGKKCNYKEQRMCIAHSCACGVAKRQWRLFSKDRSGNVDRLRHLHCTPQCASLAERFLYIRKALS